MSVELNADKKKAIEILDYWFLVEFLNQQSLKSFEEKRKKTNTYKGNLNSGKVKSLKKVVENFVQFEAEDRLQTIAQTASEEMQLPLWSDFTVFVGCIKKEFCIKKIAQKVE